MSHNDMIFDQARDEGNPKVRPMHYTEIELTLNCIVTYWSLLYFAKTFEAKKYQEATVEKRIIRFSNKLQQELIRHEILKRTGGA